MPAEIVIPSLGESVSEGVIARWTRSDGEFVNRDEPVLELETDKITMEVPAPASGVLHAKAKVGQTVPVGAVVGSIDESAKPAAGAKSAAPAKPASGAAPSPPPSAKVSPAPAPKSPAGSTAPRPDANDARLTPLARKIVEEQRVDVSRISGTGPGGRIREQDVLAFIQSQQPGAPAAGPPGAQSPAQKAVRSAEVVPSLDSRAVTRERMSPLRQRIAARLVEAQRTAAMLTTFNECDMTAVMSLRKAHKEAFEKQHGVGLGFMPFFVRACVSAIEAFPRVGAQVADGPDGPELVQHHYCDIAIAVGTPKGLVVPVVRNCERLSFAQIEGAIRDLAARARDGKLTLEEMQGGTFTITNGGVYGSLMSTPILNPPQSAILGMHKILNRPVEDPDRPGQVALRPMMYLALSYDHRVIDGEQAVSFLVRVRQCVEDPARMLIGL